VLRSMCRLYEDVKVEDLVLQLNADKLRLV
jgi:hypothetical protein